MSLTRRALLAGAGVLGAGVVVAGAKAATGALADDGGIGASDSRSLVGTTPAPTAFSAPSAVVPSTAAVPTPVATRPLPIAGAASVGAIASVTPTPRATKRPTPSASLTASPTPSSTATTSTSASASATPPGDTGSDTESAAPSASSSPSGSGMRSAGPSFVSGSSCIGAANGAFGSWRGRRVQVASTWGRDGETYVVDPGAEYGSWKGSLDYAPQYDLERTGSPFTWSAMAGGAYDGRLRDDMRNLKARWSGKQGVLYYRFQHEFNGDWYRWTVDEGNAKAMIEGWRRMAGLFRDVFGNDPRYRIAWSPNAGSTPKRFRDIRSAWPGRSYVDVIAIDFYDFFKPRNAGDWDRMLNSVDGGGGPVGIGAWQRFAADQGLPWSVPEWGNQYGDNAYYIQRMYDCFSEHAYSGAGSDAGKLIYEAYFNQVFPGSGIDSGGDFRVQVDGGDHPGRPGAARRYRELFGR